MVLVFFKNVKFHKVDVHIYAFQALSGLYLASSHCPLVRYVALVGHDVFINTGIVEKFAQAETVAANRVYGDLLRDQGPARDPAAPHHVPHYAWPWSRFPPFLGPAFLLFSSDTLPHLFLSAPNVPPTTLWEVWLTGLLGLHAGVLRIGVRDFFMPLSSQV